MLSITIIAVGQLKEKYFREAADEYKKRISGTCRIAEVEIKEEKIPDNASDAQIATALDKEADRILDAVPKRSFVVAMCIEGKHMSSEQFAATLDNAALMGKSSVCFIIGSSHGLSHKIKDSSDLKLSMSKMTFPHKLARVMLFEAVYRAEEILSGSKYHK